MKKLILLSIFLGCWGVVILPGHVLAEEKGTVPEMAAGLSLSGDLKLKDLLTYAYRSNPTITASKASWEAFIENYRIGKSYPDPQLMTTVFPRPIETRLGPQDWNLTLSQAIPFPGTLSQKAKVLEADVRISKLKLDKAVKKMVSAVSSSFYELVYIQKALELARANLAINQKLTAISENAYARDKGLFYDVSKAQAQSAQIRYDILLLEQLEQTEKTRLNTLLDRRPNAPLGKAVPLPMKTVVYSLEEVYELSSVFQEDLLIADETIQKSKETVKLTRFENLPKFKFGLFYAAIGTPGVPSLPRDAGEDAVGIQMGASLPLWFGKNQSKVAKAKALEAKAKAEKRMAANRIRAEISRIWFKLQNSRRLISLYKKELLPQATASLQTAETWYREGHGSFSDYLEIQASAYNFQLSLARARADYGKNLVQLEQLAGVILDRKDPERTTGGNDQ